MGSKSDDSLIHPISDWLASQGVALRTVSQPESNSTISVVQWRTTSAIPASVGFRCSIQQDGRHICGRAFRKTGIHHHGEQDTVVCLCP
jgi:hypothetical protein